MKNFIRPLSKSLALSLLLRNASCNYSAKEVKDNFTQTETPEQMMKDMKVDTSKYTFVPLGSPNLIKLENVTLDPKMGLDDLSEHGYELLNVHYKGGGLTNEISGKGYGTRKKSGTDPRTYVIEFTVIYNDEGGFDLEVNEIGFVKSKPVANDGKEDTRNPPFEKAPNEMEWKFENGLSSGESENTESNLNTEINNRTEQDIAAKRGVNLSKYTLEKNKFNLVGHPELSSQAALIDMRKNNGYDIKFNNTNSYTLAKGDEVLCMYVTWADPYEGGGISLKYGTVAEGKEKK